MAVVATLVIKVAGDASPLERELGGVEKSFGRLGSKMQSIGGDLTKGLSLPLAAIGGFAAKSAIDFESSFAGIKKTVNATDEEFAKLAQGMRDLAKTMPVNVNELNRIGEAAGQLGIHKEDILGFTETMAKLGATTNLSADEAATSIAQIQNIFNASGQQTENFASALVALGNAGASTERDIVEMAARIAGAANQVGISQADVLGFSSALANLGINAEAGGTAISRVMSSISVAVDMGGEKLAGFATVAGMSATAFQELFKADASEAVTRFVEGLGRAKESGANLTGILKELGQGDIRVMDALKRMAGAGDQLRTSLDLARSSWQQNTALSEEFQERANTTASYLTVLWNRINDVAITLGTAMLPALKGLVSASDPAIKLLESLVEGFAGLPMPIQATAFAMAGIAAAAGPVIYVAGTLVRSWGALAGALSLGTAAVGSTGATAAGAAIGVSALASAFASLTTGVLGFSVGWSAGRYLDNFTIGGLRPSDWVEFLFAWQYGLGGVSAENVRLAITSRNAAEAAALLPKVAAPTMFQPQEFETGTSFETALHLSKVGGPGLAGGLMMGDGGAYAPPPAAAAQVSAYEQAIRSLTDRLSGQELVAGVNQWMEAIERVGGIGALTHDELTQFQNDVVAAVEKMRIMGDVVPRTWALIADSIRNNSILQASRDSLGSSLSMVGGLNEQQLLLPSSQGDMSALMTAIPPAISNQNASAGMSKQVSTLRADIAMLSESFAQLGQIGDGALSAVTRGIGSAISSINVGTNAITSLKNGFASLGSGSTLQGLAGLASGIGSIVGIASLATKGISALINKLKGGEEGQFVNPARDAFLAEFGAAGGTGAGSGFGNLAAQLTELTGEEGGGSLFRALTQADTMAEFDAAVAAIEAKLASAKTGMDGVSTATDTFNMNLTGSDEAIKQLGATQLTVTEMMLQGFSSLIAKLDEMIARLGVANAMAGSLGGVAIGGERAVGGETAQAYGGGGDVAEMLPAFNESAESGAPSVTINAGTIIGNPDELAEMVLNSVEGGGRVYGRFRILSGQAVGL